MSVENERIERIILAVSNEFNLNPVAILSKKRGDKPVCIGRQVVALLLRDNMHRSDLARLLGRDSEQYVSGAVRGVTRRAVMDHDFFISVAKLCDRFSVNWRELP